MRVFGMVALDVCYDDVTQVAHSAAVGFNDWTEGHAQATFLTAIQGVAPYVPGSFFERELPCLLAVLKEHRIAPGILIVDGFVHLDSTGRPGLGQYLYEALDSKIPVIGVAKTRFAGLDAACEVLRGKSSRPLYVTSAGIDLETAKAHVRCMHGKHRIPTLLTQVDHVSRRWP